MILHSRLSSDDGRLRRLCNPRVLCTRVTVAVVSNEAACASIPAPRWEILRYGGAIAMRLVSWAALRPAYPTLTVLRRKQIMNRMYKVARRFLAVERLDNRELMAADLIQVGASCPEVPSTTQLVNTASTATAATATKAKPSYTYSILGNPKDATTPAPSAGLALVGGGTDIDEVFKWMGAQSKGGDFVVLSASKNGYLKYINGLTTLDSVESLVVPDRNAANDDFVASVVASAEALFITGGDQSNYINNWSNSKLEDAIYAMLRRGGVIGGTSAGLAVLGNVDYAALNDSTTSTEALNNPLTTTITLDKDFITPDEIVGTPLQYLQETITDPHFMQRDRMGRTMAFMARADYEDKVDRFPRAIAVNEQTALLIDRTGSALLLAIHTTRKARRIPSSVASTSWTQPPMRT